MAGLTQSNNTGGLRLTTVTFKTHRPQKTRTSKTFRRLDERDNAGSDRLRNRTICSTQGGSHWEIKQDHRGLNGGGAKINFRFTLCTIFCQAVFFPTKNKLFDMQTEGNTMRKLYPRKMQALPGKVGVTSLSADRSEWEYEYAHDPQEEQEPTSPQHRPVNAIRRQEEDGLEMMIEGLYGIKKTMQRAEKRQASVMSAFTEEQLVKMRRGHKITLRAGQAQHLKNLGWTQVPYPPSDSCFWHYQFNLHDGYIFTESTIWQQGKGLNVDDLQDTVEIGMGVFKTYFGGKAFFKAGREHV